jgi:hypothetical protein
MYLVRRIYKVKPGATRKAAQLMTLIAKEYEQVGRSPAMVYWSGYTVPGPENTVYMDWTQETLGSPYDPDAKAPEGLGEVYGQLNELQESSSIEFYEIV